MQSSSLSTGPRSWIPEWKPEEEETEKNKGENMEKNEKQDEKRPEDKIKVFLGYVTTSGPQMLAFIDENKQCVQVWCICETHLAGEAAESTAWG